MIPLQYQQSPAYCGTASLDSSMIVSVALDTTLQLGGGQAPTSPVSTLTNVDRNVPYVTGLVTTPTISGNLILQEIGPLPPANYVLHITYTPSPVTFTGEKLSVLIGILVPA